MWIARDKDGTLSIYSRKPERYEDYFISTDVYERYIEIKETKETKKLTWENSPQRIEFIIKIKE